jgi:hypothetical protein
MTTPEIAPRDEPPAAAQTTGAWNSAVKSTADLIGSNPHLSDKDGATGYGGNRCEHFIGGPAAEGRDCQMEGL